MSGLPRILVTGGAGFIGSNFVLEWVGLGGRVVNLDRLTYAGNPENLAGLSAQASLAAGGGHELVEGDIGDGELVAALLERHRPEAVVHFAAESHVDRSIANPDAFIRTNVNGTFTLLEAARRYWEQLRGEERSRFRFLHVSTDEVYGSLGSLDAPFTERTPYAPNSPYAASKAASDHLVRAYVHTYGLPAVTTNCSNNYGPFQFPEKLIPLVTLEALESRPLPVYGDGANVRDWLYVGDHCAAIRRVLERGRLGETYNVGGNSERSNLEVVRAVCELVDELRPRADGVRRESLIRFVADRPGHDRRYAIDAGKIRTELGWEPAVSFEEGLRQTVGWYLEHSDWVERVRTGAYREWMRANYGQRGGQ